MSSKNKALKAKSKANALSRPATFVGDLEFNLIYQWPEGDIGQWLHSMISRHLRKGKFEYIDNWRWAEYGNKAQEDAYVVARNKGCCGFEDVTYEHPKTKRKFRIGFNYGH